MLRAKCGTSMLALGVREGKTLHDLRPGTLPAPLRDDCERRATSALQRAREIFEELDEVGQVAAASFQQGRLFHAACRHELPAAGVSGGSSADMVVLCAPRTRRLRPLHSLAQRHLDRAIELYSRLVDDARGRGDADAALALAAPLALSFAQAARLELDVARGVDDGSAGAVRGRSSAASMASRCVQAVEDVIQWLQQRSGTRDKRPNAQGAHLARLVHELQVLVQVATAAP